MSNSVSDCWFRFHFHYSHKVVILADIKLNRNLTRKFHTKTPKLLIIIDRFKDIHGIGFFIFLFLEFWISTIFSVVLASHPFLGKACMNPLTHSFAG